MDLETVSCALCGMNDTEQLFVASDTRYRVPGAFPVVRCRRCGLVYTNPRPAPAALANYYPAAYRPHAGGRQHSGRFGAAVRAAAFAQLPGPLGAGAAWLYNSLAYRAFVRGSPGRVLDIGCATGEYLAVWAQLGWQVEGIEPNEDAARAAAERLGAAIRVGLAEELALPSARYDVVTLSHSFEHVRSPRALLASVAEALVPRGRLVLMVPNFAAWDRHAFGSSWYSLEVPRHLYHFEPSTLSALLEDCGFTIEALGGSAHSDGLLRTLRQVLGRQGPASAVTRAAAAIAQLPLAAARRTTALWVIARSGS